MFDCDVNEKVKADADLCNAKMRESGLDCHKNLIGPPPEPEGQITARLVEVTRVISKGADQRGKICAATKAKKTAVGDWLTRARSHGLIDHNGDNGKALRWHVTDKGREYLAGLDK